MKKYFIFIAQFIISGLLIFFVFKNINFEELYQVLKTVKIEFILLALMFFAASLIGTIFKWYFLAQKTMGELPPFRFFLSYYLVGIFYAFFVPAGQVLGEGIKAWRISNKSDFKHSLYVSVFADKVTGFMALSGLVVISFLSQDILFTDKVSIVSLLLSIAIAVAGIIIMFSRKLSEYLFMFMEYFINFFPKSVSSHFKKIKYHFLEYQNHKKATISSIVMGVVSQLGLVVAIYCITLSLGVSAPFLFVAWTFLIMIVATFLPISYAGLGIREGTFVYFFSLINVPKEMALSISFVVFGFQILPALIGGCFEFKEIWLKNK